MAESKIVLMASSSVTLTRCPATHANAVGRLPLCTPADDPALNSLTASILPMRWRGTHCLGRSDAFTNWGAFDVSDTLYAHPCDPDIIRRMPLWKRLWAHIRRVFRTLKLRSS